MRVLALSSSKVGDGNYLATALPLIKKFLGQQPLSIAFIPFASADNDYETYAAKVKEGLTTLPHTIKVITSANEKEVIESSDAIMVGGGNTFKLLHDIYHYDLFQLVKEKIAGGTPYIGWSAGANLTGLTICTTNDMPIVQPQSFKAFGFLPFQINPHYYNVVIEGFHGETRDQRLSEFILLNPDVPVIGIPEGTALQLENNQLQLLGEREAVLFHSGKNSALPGKTTIPPGADVSYLLQQAIP